MYTNDILTRLQNGESVEEIGKEFAEALNAANRLHQEEERAKLASASKEEIAGRLMSAFIDYIDCVDHDLADRIDVSDEDLKEIVKMLDRTIPMISLLVQLQEEKEVDDDTRMGNWFSIMGF